MLCVRSLATLVLLRGDIMTAGALREELSGKGTVLMYVCAGSGSVCAVCDEAVCCW